MASTKLSQLTEVTTLTSADEIYVNDDGTSKRLTYANLLTTLQTSLGVNITTSISSGTGTPEGVVTGGVGDLFLRTDGTAGATLYVKESGAGNTGWAATESDITTETLLLVVGDETTALTTGTAKLTFRMPYAFTLTGIRASVTTAPTGSVLTVDVNETGTTILSTKITIDDGEKTSQTAATPPVISDSALADDAEITIDIDTVGSTIAGTGLKVYLIGNQ